jgi:Brp/Blh family beta-carotene 15,15'-monooxygenase
MTINTIDILAILGVILFGIPHGALDWELVKHSDSQPKLMRFLCFYLGFTAFGLFLWIMVPTATLLFFLLITAGHFGRADPFGLAVLDVHNHFLKTANILFQGGAVSVFLPWVHWSTVEPLLCAQFASVFLSKKSVFYWASQHIMRFIVFLTRSSHLLSFSVFCIQRHTISRPQNI